MRARLRPVLRASTRTSMRGCARRPPLAAARVAKTHRCSAAATSPQQPAAVNARLADASPLPRRVLLTAVALLASAPGAARCVHSSLAGVLHLTNCATDRTAQRRAKRASQRRAAARSGRTVGAVRCAFQLLCPRKIADAPCPTPAALSAGYVQAVRGVIASLSASIAVEAGGASEREVRRKADPAKAAVERFLRDWKGDARVVGEPSYAAVVGARGSAAPCAVHRPHLHVLGS